MKREVVIVSAVRTAVGRMGGTLKDIDDAQLLAPVLQEALRRANIEPSQLDEVIMGQVKQSADTNNLARVAALRANFPITVPAYTVHRACASGLQAIHCGAQAISVGEATVVLGGGAENMSKAIYYLRDARYGYGAGNGELLDSNTESQPRSQPEEVYGRLTMGLTAENVAEKYDISREDQDEFALLSQTKAAKAIKEGKFKEEILPIMVPQRKAEPISFEVDEHPRLTSLEKLAKLPPVFKKGGTVTAGNSSGRNDGAAAVLLMEGQKAEAMGIKPMVRILAQSAVGVCPSIMGMGPVEAVKNVLKKTGLTLDQIDLIELNEAFAAQSLGVIRALNLDVERLNVNGGAIALGHPLGCTGAKIMVTLIHEMKRRKSKYGIVTLCIGGGMGIATLEENL